MRAQTFILVSLIALASGHPDPAWATPPAPPAPLKWDRAAWQCPHRQRSSIEIEMLAQGEQGYRLRVTELTLDGKSLHTEAVDGLKDILARRNYLRIAGGYCERDGEVIGIEELANGPKANEAGWRRLYVPYAKAPE